MTSSTYLLDFQEINDSLNLFLETHKIIFSSNKLDVIMANLCERIKKKNDYPLVAMVILGDKRSFFKACAEEDIEDKLYNWFDGQRESLEREGCPIERKFKDKPYLKFSLEDIPKELSIFRDSLVNKEVKELLLFPIKVEKEYFGLLIVATKHFLSELKINLFLNFLEIFATLLKNFYLERVKKELIDKIIDQEIYLNKIFSKIPLGIIYVSHPERKIEFINDYLAKLLGYQKKELIGQSTRILYFTEQEFENLGRLIYSSLEDREYLQLSEAIFRTKNNKKIFVNLTITAEKENKEIKSVLAFVEDISFRKNILNSLNEALVIIDKESRLVVDLNQKFLDLFEVDSKLDVLSQRIDKRLFYNYLDREYILDRLDKEEEINNYEMLMRTYKEKVFTGLLSVKKVYWEGREYFLIIIRDITEFKALQRMLAHSQKMESLGLLAGGIAHDFNNILTIILGFAELGLKHIEQREKIKKYLENILEASQRSQKLIQQLLTFSRQKIGEDRYPLEITPLIKEQLKLLRDTLPSVIELKSSISSKGIVRSNPTEIQQILMNLITNAYQALQKKGGVIEVDLYDFNLEQDQLMEENLYLPKGKYVCLEVKDNGPGIPQEYLSKLFEPFFTTKKQGTGMGLAIVASIVKGLGGSVWAGNRERGGAIFKIYLPRFELKKGEKLENNKKTLKEAKKLPQLNIMLVDDFKDVLDIMEHYLKELGMHVYSFSSSQRALEFFKENFKKIDLAILDVSMPELNGKELALELRKIKENLPTVFLTGYTDLLDEKEARKMQAYYFQKPITLEKLKKIISLVWEVKNG